MAENEEHDTYHARPHEEEHEGVDCWVVENTDVDEVRTHHEPPNAQADAEETADLLNEIDHSEAWEVED